MQPQPRSTQFVILTAFALERLLMGFLTAPTLYLLLLAPAVHGSRRCRVNERGLIYDGDDCGLGSSSVRKDVGDRCTSDSNCGSAVLFNGDLVYPCLCRDSNYQTCNVGQSRCMDGSCDSGCCPEHRELRTPEQQESCDNAAAIGGGILIVFIGLSLGLPLCGIFACINSKKAAGMGEPLPQAWMICTLLFCFTGPCFMWIPFILDQCYRGRANYGNTNVTITTVGTAPPQPGYAMGQPQMYGGQQQQQMYGGQQPMMAQAQAMPVMAQATAMPVQAQGMPMHAQAMPAQGQPVMAQATAMPVPKQQGP